MSRIILVFTAVSDALAPEFEPLAVALAFPPFLPAPVAFFGA